MNTKLHQIHIFDIDGIIADSSHRYRTKVRENGKEGIDLTYWRNNETKCLDDQPTPFADFIKAMKSMNNHTVFLATSRAMCDNCFLWLENTLGFHPYVVSRNGNNDTRKGAELKFKGIRRLLNLNQFHPEKVAAIHIYEDSLEYLRGLQNSFSSLGYYTVGHHYPSCQGH